MAAGISSPSSSLRLESEKRIRKAAQSSFARGGVVDRDEQASLREAEIAGSLKAQQESLARAKEFKLEEERQAETERSNRESAVIAREELAANEAANRAKINEARELRKQAEPTFIQGLFDT